MPNPDIEYPLREDATDEELRRHFAARPERPEDLRRPQPAFSGPGVGGGSEPPATAPRARAPSTRRFDARAQRRRDREARAAGIRRRNEQAASDRARAERQAWIEERDRQRRRALERFWAHIWSWIKFLFWCALGIWALSKWETVATWYYSLIPHPARDLVHGAVNSGAPIDQALHHAIENVSAENRVERAVRVRQANELTAMLRRHEAALRAQSERQIAEERIRVERETRLQRAHVELMQAGVAHEDAAAGAAALRDRR